MANTKANVSTGKPRVTGGIWRAPKGTTLPTDASTELDEAYKCMGYVSEDGVSNEREVDEEVKAWGGDTVIQTLLDTFKFTLIEAMNTDVLKLVYGDENVTGSLTEGIKITANDDPHEEGVLVIDLALRGALKRIVIPAGQVTEVGEVTYADGDVTGYETTVTAHEDEEGNTHYEYIKTKSKA